MAIFEYHDPKTANANQDGSVEDQSSSFKIEVTMVKDDNSKSRTYQTMGLASGAALWFSEIIEEEHESDSGTIDYNNFVNDAKDGCQTNQQL